MSAISPISPLSFSLPQSSGMSAVDMLPLMTDAAATDVPSDAELALQDKFQEFVVGSFYKQMLKALRSAERPSKYFNGGQAEKIFRSQLDQVVTDDLAKRGDQALSNPLYTQFIQQLGELPRM